MKNYLIQQQIYYAYLEIQIYMEQQMNSNRVESQLKHFFNFSIYGVLFEVFENNVPNIVNSNRIESQLKHFFSFFIYGVLFEVWGIHFQKKSQMQYD